MSGCCVHHVTACVLASIYVLLPQSMCPTTFGFRLAEWCGSAWAESHGDPTMIGENDWEWRWPRAHRRIRILWLQKTEDAERSVIFQAYNVGIFKWKVDISTLRISLPVKKALSESILRSCTLMEKLLARMVGQSHLRSAS